jgi:hypothetical protein
MDKSTKIRIASELVGLAKEVVAAEWEGVKGRPSRQRRKMPDGSFQYRDKPGGKKKGPAKKDTGGKMKSVSIKPGGGVMSYKPEGTLPAGDYEVVGEAYGGKAVVLKGPGGKEYSVATRELEGVMPKGMKPTIKKSPAKGKKTAPKSFGKHKKSTPKVSSLKKVQNVMKEHGVDEESDELGEMTGFKKTLGQRVPEAKHGEFYVRNETKLKSDFIKNMNPANYDSPEAFKKAQERMKKMPASDFGKILAAITAEDDTEE